MTRSIRARSVVGSGISSGWPVASRRFTGRGVWALPARWLSICPVYARCWRPGRISEDTAATVVCETRHLVGELRRLVDKQLCAEGIDTLSARRAAALTKRLAYEADRAGYVARGRTARSDRRVGLRPAPDTMSVLSGLLPVEQGVACLAALRRQHRCGDGGG